MKTNAQKMAIAVERWIAEARRLPKRDGQAALQKRAKWFDTQFTALERAAIEDRAIPEHLTGLTAVDMIEAHGKLMVGMRRLGEGK